MLSLFYLVIILFILTIFLEFISLFLQEKYMLFTTLFKNKDFLLHSVVSLFFWSISAIAYFFLVLTFKSHPKISCNYVLCTFFGGTLTIIGVIISTLGFLKLGLKRSLHVNFFRKNIPKEKEGIYHYVKNPEYCGFWSILLGLALITKSLYLLLVFIEVFVFLYALMVFENKKL